jgi:sugar O-acyltransferase (sialic acid O-acetyltransferase NeuD family)
MSGLLVVGAGGHGKVVADTAAELGRYDRIAFLDDRYPELTQVEDWPVLGRCGDARTRRDDFFDLVVGIGDNARRLEMSLRYLTDGFRLATIVHPRAFVSSRATLGAGTVVLAQAALNAGARTGRTCILNTGSTVDHDCSLEDAVHICPGAYLGGSVSVGPCSWIGIGSSISHDVGIGRNVIIGAGAAVVSDIPDDVTAGGVPARVIRQHEPEEDRRIR